MKRLLCFLLVVHIIDSAWAADAFELPVSLFGSMRHSNTSGAFGYHTIDQTTDALEMMFMCSEGETITSLGYRYHSRNAGDPVEHQISIQGVDGSGNPDGSIKASGNAKASFNPPADATWDGTFRWNTLDSSYTCTQGEFLFAVISPVGTPDSSNKSQFAYYEGNAMPFVGTPYNITNEAGTRTRTTGLSILGWKSASKIYGLPIKDYQFTTWASDTNPGDERGAAFVIPSTWCSTFKLAGIIMQGHVGPASGSTKLILYTGTTNLQETTIDGDYIRTAAQNNAVRVMLGGTTQTLTCGSTYRIAFQAQSTGGSNMSMGYIAVEDNADLAAFPLGINTYYTYRTDAGSWSDTTTRLPQMSLLLRDITVSTTGGVKGVGGMSGGMQ